MLAVAVLRQAINDFVYSEHDDLREDARRYLFDDVAGQLALVEFEAGCHALKVDPERVRLMVLSLVGERRRRRLVLARIGHRRIGARP